MTMTPERRQEVGERLKLYKSGTPCKPQAAFAEVLRLWNETLAAYDSLTAEIATLRAEAEKDRCVTCLYCNTHFQYEKIDEATFKVLYQKMLEHDAECTANPNVQMIATLKAHLKAVVEAGEAVCNANDDDEREWNLDMTIDALRSAIDAAKGAVCEHYGD